jgi:hypothetical protein
MGTNVLPNGKFGRTNAEWQSPTTWIDANIPYSGEMYHRRAADGRENVWGEYKWTPVWDFPKSVPALGEQIPKGLIQLTEAK